ncbi:ATP-binding cassette domain-containing protein [Vibrio sp. TH_r3]|uniref:ABC transporter ATP-binding protein n=1 Tax=Vibrio sp. TH_r3 TaxID=3082084 RepID=UPI0029538605|nr:oligopeptide/dipeptide ABC transporter ATP-binding protein [Vibrio sp. TH_r3]MDV7103601.1 ATP-binding cassette domain-containing protein [Vibrio sp. TH_r3]
MEDIILKIDNVSKRFTLPSNAIDRLVSRITKQPLNDTVHAVSQISVEVKKGEVLGIVGESGCGKSTLGRIISGIYTPSDGNVTLNGQPVAQFRDGRVVKATTKVQMIHQDPFASLNPRMRIGEQISEGPVKNGIIHKSDAANRVQELLQQVGLNPSYANRFPHQFSGGQRQRIAIARALAMEPDILVFDEAVASLDVSIQAQVLNLFMDLRKKLNLTAIFISHDLSVVRHVCDRVAIMYLGRMVELAGSEDLHKQRYHPYSQALYSAIPELGKEKGEFNPVIGEIPSPLSPPSGCAFHPRCPIAQPICSKQYPETTTVDGRRFACHVLNK